MGWVSAKRATFEPSAAQFWAVPGGLPTSTAKGMARVIDSEGSPFPLHRTAQSQGLGAVPI